MSKSYASSSIPHIGMLSLVFWLDLSYSLILLFNHTSHPRYKNSWCEKHFINNKAMRKAREVRSQILDLLQKQKMKHVSGSEDMVREAICR